MQVKVLKKTSDELKIEIEGVGHTFCNMLQKKILEDAHVDMAGYAVPHPLASNPVIYVRVKGDVKPEKVLREALERTRDMNKEFGKEFERALNKA